MFDFIKDYLNRKALKQALTELDMENSAQDLIEPVAMREYKTNSEENGYKKLKKNNALSKPQTESIDLKNFKNWRSDNKPESKSKEPSLKKPFVFDIDTDDGDQPAIENPVSRSKFSMVDEIASINNSKEKEEKEDTSISDFFKEKYQTKFKEEKVEESLVNQEKPVRTKTTLNELLKKKAENENKNKISNEQTEIKPEEKKIKVEVVDFSNSEEPKPKKKVVNRKPRGKNKRKFDADVISAIDWK